MPNCIAKILAIDDKQDNLTAISALLKALIPECSIITAQSGVEGIEKAKTKLPDTILLDIKMPGMDGFEVCRRLKADESTKYIPVILLTAIKTDSADRIKGLEIGADAFIAKPIDEAELVAQVKVGLRIKIIENYLRKEKIILSEINAQLQQEIIDRKRAEKALYKARDELEIKVNERTSELIETNKKLRVEISERKQAEKALRQSEEKLSGIINSISDQIIIVNQQLNIVWANDVARQLFGPELIGKKCHTVDSRRNQPCKDCLIKKCLNDGNKHKKEINLIASNGNQMNFLVTTNVYKSYEDGRPQMVIAIFHYITEIKKLQAETMRAAHLASIGELAAGVAHEINNPINGIINLAQLLINKSDPKSLEYDIANRIVKEGNRIANIVSSLLSFARKDNRQKNPINLNEILVDTFALTEVQLRKDGINLKVNTLSNFSEIIGNFQQIEQVFLNIIHNARYALNQRFPEAHKNKILQILCEESTLDGRPCVRIIFLDKGIGIPSNIREKVMDPFFPTKPTEKGTGLGLSISHGIISDHGGHLKIDSIKGE
ncbi:MAG: response regulator, partial [Deltaproteobacteria bacterium]|nr:response regulator [Deltaproteobacteria bacterium]